MGKPKFSNTIQTVTKNGFYGYKKLRNNQIAKLYVPGGARYYYGECGNGKLRVSEAKVIWIYNVAKGRFTTKGFSGYNSSFRYSVGKTVRPVGNFSTYLNTCERGIHMFVNRKRLQTFRMHNLNWTINRYIKLIYPY